MAFADMLVLSGEPIVVHGPLVYLNFSLSNGTIHLYMQTFIIKVKTDFDSVDFLFRW